MLKKTKPKKLNRWIELYDESLREWRCGPKQFGGLTQKERDRFP
jgi:hypothetical protein